MSLMEKYHINMPHLLLWKLIDLPLSFVDSGKRIAFAKASRPVKAEPSSVQRLNPTEKTHSSNLYPCDNFKHEGFFKGYFNSSTLQAIWKDIELKINHKRFHSKKDSQLPIKCTCKVSIQCNVLPRTRPDTSCRVL